MTNALQYLAIGHVTADLLPNGRIQPGGTALYGACTAYQLGLHCAILTACSADLDLTGLPAELQISRQVSDHSTTFQNVYHERGRVQFIHATARPIDLALLPAAWRAAPIVHLGPVFMELPASADQFGASLVGVSAQGWLRRMGADRTVELEPNRLLDLPLTNVQVLVVSEEDVGGNEQLAAQMANRIPLVVLTRAERGATGWHAGKRFEVAAYPAAVVDPTGAGDVFTAALLIGLWHGRSAEAATDFACAAASHSIEALGSEGLPSEADVAARIRRGRPSAGS
ncbi:MAG: PfkB family carbohydrate kinase [Herpetosiphon sp.]